MHNGPHGPIIARPSAVTGSMFTSPGSSTTTGQTQGPAGMGGPPPQQQQQSVDPILNAAAVQAANQAAQQSDPIPGGTMIIGSGNPNQLAAQTMLQAGITNLGGSTPGFQGTGSGNLTVTSGSGQGTDTSGSDQGTDSSDTSDEGEGIDDIFFKIFTGEEIKQLSPERLKRAKSVLSQYISLGETNPLKLRALMTGNIAGGIFGKDQTVSDMEGNIVKPEDAFNPDGTLKEGLRYTKEGIIKLLDEDQEGGNILESLKKFNPELYYPFMGMPATSGSLVDLAKIPVTEEMQGTNPELVKMIFDARMELDRMGKNPMTGESQGQGGQGITSIPSSNFIDTITTPNMDITKPGYTGDPNNPFGLPGDYGAGFMQSQFYKPGQPGLAVMTPVKLPDGTTHMFPDSSSANQFQQYLDDLAMNKMGPYAGPYQSVTTSTGIPAAFNYASIAPQFTGSPYTNQGVSPAFLENLRRFYG
jgi:hypothetical protein